MMKLFHSLAFIVLALMATPGFADDDHKRARDLVESGEILPLDVIIKTAFEGKPWKLLEAELEKEKGQYVYELEILDDHGKVRELKYDAKTGKPVTREKN